MQPMILFVMAVRGELATNSREQQEIVTLSLQLLQNCMMLINTILLERTIEREPHSFALSCVRGGRVADLSALSAKISTERGSWARL